ncbi:hypothetical protein MMC24_001583 [Lignoscripta atroalba]|nr:hypothetical protein [Lignoscripta atroalba]
MSTPLWTDGHVVGARAHIFQPPTTPSASTLLYQSTDSLSKQNVNGDTSRKRARHDSLLSHQSASYSASANGWATVTSGPSSTVSTPGMMSPMPFVNTQYRLAGGLDTPSAATASAYENNYGESTTDVAFRRGRGWSNGGSGGSEGYFPYTPLALAREGNGRKKVYNSSPTHGGWSKAVFTVVGGVAGKVWEFCKAGAFRGFYAGGGQGYAIQQHQQQLDTSRSSIWSDIPEKGDIFASTSKATNTIPGGFPAEDFIQDYMSQDHTISPASPRPSKKLQRSKGSGDLRTSWILINDIPTSRESSPSRISARKVPRASSPTRRPAPSKPPTRRPILPASRPSLTSHAGSPAMRPGRPASSASTRSPATTPAYDDTTTTSPASVEAKRYAAMVRRREHEEDRNLRRLNKQLKAMIKEGKEALGTRIEVDIEGEGEETLDEGYAEGEDFEEVRKVWR